MAKAPSKGPASLTVIDPATLTDEDRASLRARAAKTIDAEVKQATVDAMYEQFLKEEREKRNPVDEIKYICLDLAAHSDRIMLDGTIYFHGTTYAVPRRVYEVLREVVQNGWRHERETEGKLNRNAYRKPVQPVLSGGERV